MRYKIKNSTWNIETTLGAVSGGFDPIHVGHIKMIKEAAALVDELIVILNTDEWLKRKKGYVFMPLKERAAILKALRGIDGVFVSIDDDDTVCKSLEYLKPDIFFNGGDRKKKNTPEEKLCQELGTKTLYEVGGRKVQSSSELARKVKK